MLKPTQCILFALSIMFAAPWHSHAQDGAKLPSKPNIVFILADDLGYNDVSCYGQSKFKTPNIDRLAANGLRFTQAYAGSAACGPSRCVLMTGLNTGHCRIRGNTCYAGGIKKGPRGPHIRRSRT